ncbi:hypothetical protein SADUNF_Sadunf19G0081300 [Salix dunnii]|uniref:TF-B3 domain-containing protein n=1 Tax=Salix dunnii TaxID=1413687 RepID=A0A835J4G3_9ROSI|nr:hypothetical protein SADUNF_Sadunf19G0081300 [Salix dunnii]
MEYLGRLISDDHGRDPLYFDFDWEFDDGGDAEGFDGMLQHIREVTSDEGEALRLLTQKVAEEFVWYNVTSREKDYLKDKNGVRCGKPPGLSIPRRMRGDRDQIPFVSKKKRSDNKKKSRSYFFSSVDRSTRAEDKIEAQRKRKKRTRGVDEKGEGVKRLTGKKKRKVEKVCLKKLGFDQLDFSDEIKPLISWQEGTDEDFKLRITKRLFQTDMSDYHDRLSMPMNQIKDFEGFLNDEENKELAKPKSETKGIEVKLFDLTGVSHIETMRLRKWDMKTSSCLMLTTSWKSVLNKGVLQKNDFVQIYSFRRNENLCFVLIKVCDGQGCRDGAFGNRMKNEDEAS